MQTNPLTFESVEKMANALGAKFWSEPDGFHLTWTARSFDEACVSAVFVTLDRVVEFLNEGASNQEMFPE